MLLILAGVSISLVVGDNGVLTRASDSSKKTKTSQIYEAVGLALADIQTQYMAEKAEAYSTTAAEWFTIQNLAYALKVQGYQIKDNAVPSGMTKLRAATTGEGGNGDTALSGPYTIGDGSDAVNFTFTAGLNGYTISAPATANDATLVDFTSGT
ncbi:MAG: hypothetical protein IJ867_00465 [Clostridia bacterium]|nr:hypothetical protein [Clostridia bacterium]